MEKELKELTEAFAEYQKWESKDTRDAYLDAAAIMVKMVNAAMNEGKTLTVTTRKGETYIFTKDLFVSWHRISGFRVRHVDPITGYKIWVGVELGQAQSIEEGAQDG